MSGAATQAGIRTPGEVFPTVDHPPRNILMGNSHDCCPGDGLMADFFFPTVVAPVGSCFPHLIILPDVF